MLSREKYDAFRIGSANNEPINVRRCYECNFIIDGHRSYGNGRALLFIAWLNQSVSSIGSGRRLKAATHYQHALWIVPLHSTTFGLKPVPGIFQQYMDALIAGLDGTAAYLDDILVTGRTIGEHNARLEVVFKRIQDYGLRVRLDKCAFLQAEITYLRFVIKAQGLQSTSLF
ncbi:hypothetical protein RB195_022748 [Necator americanus]|uniref:Reverse transcriptase domain-containing protein n=1 Tax=Necator americanus TaxID=51031 RepID=A0ABR1EGH3_NECAM